MLEKFTEEINIRIMKELYELGYMNIKKLSNGTITFENSDGVKMKMRAIRFSLIGESE